MVVPDLRPAASALAFPYVVTEGADHFKINQIRQNTAQWDYIQTFLEKAMGPKKRFYTTVTSNSSTVSPELCEVDSAFAVTAAVIR